MATTRAAGKAAAGATTCDLENSPLNPGQLEKALIQYRRDDRWDPF